jgi:hypothetical protein
MRCTDLTRHPKTMKGPNQTVQRPQSQNTNLL